jgi:hypothetical protein
VLLGPRREPAGGPPGDLLDGGQGPGAHLRGVRGQPGGEADVLLVVAQGAQPPGLLLRAGPDQRDLPADRPGERRHPLPGGQRLGAGEGVGAAAVSVLGEGGDRHGGDVRLVHQGAGVGADLPDHALLHDGPGPVEGVGHELDRVQECPGEGARGQGLLDGTRVEVAQDRHPADPRPFGELDDPRRRVEGRVVVPAERDQVQADHPLQVGDEAVGVGEVAAHRPRPLRKTGATGGAGERADREPGAEQLVDDVAADGSGGARDEERHGSLLQLGAAGACPPVSYGVQYTVRNGVRESGGPLRRAAAQAEAAGHPARWSSTTPTAWR